MNPDFIKGKFFADQIEIYIRTLTEFYGIELTVPPHDIANFVVTHFKDKEGEKDTKRNRQHHKESRTVQS